VADVREPVAGRSLVTGSLLRSLRRAATPSSPAGCRASHEATCRAAGTGEAPAEPEWPGASAERRLARGLGLGRSSRPRPERRRSSSLRSLISPVRLGPTGARGMRRPRERGALAGVCIVLEYDTQTPRRQVGSHRSVTLGAVACATTETKERAVPCCPQTSNCM
jgi:hypothetical protein